MSSKITWCVGMSLKEIERKIIEKSMIYFDGNKTKVAASLEVSIKTIDNKLNLYKVQDERKTAS